MVAWTARMITSLLLIPLLATGPSSAPRVFGFEVPTMGTRGSIQIAATDSSSAAEAAQFALAAFSRVDSLMSNWTTTSEVARLNRRAGQRLVVEPEVSRVLAAALTIGRESEGAFDITVEPLVRLWGFLGGTPHVPPAEAIEDALRAVGSGRLRFDAETGVLEEDSTSLRIDLGGIAKGHAVDEAARALRAAGIENALVDLSGNLMPLGSPPHREAWTVGVRDPFDRAPYFARLQLAASEGIATSGDYEQFVAIDGTRYGHILDPRTGWPAHELVAVTVLAPTALEADAWATAFFVLGIENGKRIARERDDLTVILVQAARDGVHDVWVERELRTRFSVEPGMASTFSVHWF